MTAAGRKLRATLTFTLAGEPEGLPCGRHRSTPGRELIPSVMDSFNMIVQGYSGDRLLDHSGGANSYKRASKRRTSESGCPWAHVLRADAHNQGQRVGKSTA